MDTFNTATGFQQPGAPDPLQHLDALLSAEAAQLTNDELLLVSDMVEQLMRSPSHGPRHHQQHTAADAGLNLSAQIEQMLTGAMSDSLQPTQQHQRQLGPQLPQMYAPAAQVAAQRLPGMQAAHQPGHFPNHPAAVFASTSAGIHLGSGLLHGSQMLLHTPLTAPELSGGLASPSSSSASERSRPVSPHTVGPRLLQQHAAGLHPVVPAAVPAPAQPDASTQAAADVLSAALADPSTSIEEIVGMFNSVLTAGEQGARELQELLTPPEQQQQQHVQAQPTYMQHTAQLHTQLQAASHLQYQQSHPASAAAGGSSRSAGIMGMQGHCSSQQLHSSGSLGQGIFSQAAAAVPQSHASTHSIPSVTPWLSGRPSTAPLHGACKFPAGGLPAQQQPACADQEGVQGIVARMTAAAARRSRSPSVFERLTAAAPRAKAVRATAHEARRSHSPTQIERSWLDSLRDSSCSPAERNRSSSRSRSCSPQSKQQQQQQPQHANSGEPWLTAAVIQDMRRSCPVRGQGALEWDAETRSIKVTTGEVAQSVGRGQTPAQAAGGVEPGGCAHKQPVRLPPQVIEERMRRFYERNVDWKRRCAMVYERQREELAQGETAACTFVPEICKKSEKLTQDLRTSYPMRSIRPLTPLADGAGSHEELRKQLLLQQRRCASTGRIRHNQKQQQPWQGASCVASRVAASSGCDQLMPAAARRLFQDAAVRMQRAQQYKSVTLKAERKARSWSAPRCPASDGVPPRVYDHLAPDRSSPKCSQNSADEGLFKPWTNPRPQPRSKSVQRVQHKTEQTGCSEREVVEEFVALLHTAEAPQKQAVGAAAEQPTRAGTSCAAATATNHQQQQQGQQPRSASAKRIGSASKNLDLNWEEFIDRQSRFLNRKEAKVAAVAAYKYSKVAAPELSPGTKRILADKQALWASSGELSPDSRHVSAPGRTYRAPGSPLSPQHHHAANFLGRLEQQSQSQPGITSSSNGSRDGVPGGDKTSHRLHGKGGVADAHLPGECTFRPQITPKAAAKKGRSVEEMSEGDRLRREVKLEHMRVLSEARELAGATFRPDLSPSRQREGEEYQSVPPRLNISHDGLSAYMASVQEKRRQLEERRRVQERRKQEEELRECTFKPETTPVPAYITEMADVGYTARYIDKVMQNALSESPVKGGSPPFTQPQVQDAMLHSGATSRGVTSAASPLKMISTKY